MDGEALDAAAEILADEVKRQSSVVSSRTPGAVNIQGSGDVREINAGYPGGQWGWDPITAYMFDEGRPHPLFGDKHHWYAQRHWPFMALAVEIAGDKAAEAAADIVIDKINF